MGTRHWNGGVEARRDVVEAVARGRRQETRRAQVVPRSPHGEPLVEDPDIGDVAVSRVGPGRPGVRVLVVEGGPASFGEGRPHTSPDGWKTTSGTIPRGEPPTL